MAKKIWNLAIDEKVLCSKTLSNTIIPANLKYSVLGEFSDSEELCDFINCKAIEGKCTDVKCINDVLKRTGKKVVNASIDDKFSFCKPIDFKDCFYIIPINPDKGDKEKYVFHWVCLKQKDGVPKIVNRVTRAEKSAMQSVFNEKKRISSLKDLKSAFDNMGKLKDKSLPIECWSLSGRHKGFPKAAKRNLVKLRNNKSGRCIEISYKNCKFAPIKVTYSKILK